MAEKGIVYRLGWALYWSACVPAGISLLVAAFGLVGSVYGLIVGWPGEAMVEGGKFLLGGLFAALLFWLPGRAIRYVLAGD